jgi:hypothetical protein
MGPLATCYVVAGLGVMYAVIGIAALSATLTDPWGDRLQCRVRRCACADQLGTAAVFGAAPSLRLLRSGART